MVYRKPLTATRARERAEECFELSKEAVSQEHRVMLEQMAAAWERIAQDIERANGRTTAGG